MAEYHRVIGIDLGTTFSVVAAYNYDKKDVKVIPNRQNEPTTPSVVYIAQEAGSASARRPAKSWPRIPNRVIFEVKRLMGEKTRTATRRWPTARRPRARSRGRLRATSSRSSRRVPRR